jgi:hypothetical protein
MQAIAHVGANVELLVQLTTESLGVRFVRQTLAAGEFPMAGEMRAFGTQRQQETVVTLYHGGDDHSHGFHRVIVAVNLPGR